VRLLAQTQRWQATTGPSWRGRQAWGGLSLRGFLLVGGEEKQKEQAGGQNADADKRAPARVGEAGPEQPGVDDAEQQRRQRIQRYAKRAGGVGRAAAQHEQRNADEQEEKPEDGRAVFNGHLEAIAGEGTADHQQKGDRALKQ